MAGVFHYLRLCVSIVYHRLLKSNRVKPVFITKDRGDEANARCQRHRLKYGINETGFRGNMKKYGRGKPTII